jgi:ATP-dependent helicase/nuclease subunit B
MSKLPDVIFLGWEQALLDLLVNHFTDSLISEGQLDLSETIIVLPGQNAARRLQELLVAAAATQRFVYRPGRIVTPGQLPELIIESAANVVSTISSATELQCQYLLAQALMKSSEDCLKKLGLEWCAGNLQRAYGEAVILKRTVSELLATGRPFADLAKQVSELSSYDDADRWQALAEVYESYCESLSSLTLQDRDGARLRALKQPNIPFAQNIYLCGCSDLPSVTLKILQQTQSEIKSFVFAPSDFKAGFDDWGQLDVEYWSARRLELNTSQIVFAMQDSDQFVLAEQWLNDASLQKISTELLTIGVGSRELEENIPSQIGEVKLRPAAGRSMTQHRVYSFIKALHLYKVENSAASFLKLLAHSDFSSHVERKLSEGNIRDCFITTKRVLHQKLVGKIEPLVVLRNDNTLTELASVYEIVESILSPLPTKQKVPVATLVSALGAVLTDVFADPFKQDGANDQHFFVRGLEECAQILEQLKGLEALVDVNLTLEDFFPIFILELEKLRIEEVKDGGEVEVIGWLELLFDDRPSLFLMGMNEGSVPETISADLLLPNSLRQALGLQDNNRRYARDNYALHVMRASRHLYVTCSKYSRDNKLKLPSRLLLSEDRTKLTEQYHKFFDSPFKLSASLTQTSTVPSLIQIPMPISGQRINVVSVSGLNDYLACPYRFYLKHVAKVRDDSRESEEMDSALFGNLIHSVLRGFGLSEVRNSIKSEEINDFLHYELDRQISHSFPLTTVPSFPLQVESIKTRLTAFAGRQAAWAEDGWQIRDVELEMPAISIANADFEEVSIVGRIDRVDYNQQSKRWALLDYKTGDAVPDVLKSHFRGGRWYSLQLPTYRMALRQAFPDRDYDLGYVILPQSSDEAKFNLADWKDDLLLDGEQKIREVAELISSAKFWPPNSDYRGFDAYPFVEGHVCL